MTFHDLVIIRADIYVSIVTLEAVDVVVGVLSPFIMEVVYTGLGQIREPNNIKPDPLVISVGNLISVLT